jgi:short subunit dehydrogenase-like uncharacterized protein
LKSWFVILYIAYLGLLMKLTTWSTVFKRFVLKYVSIFTFGVFSKSGPTEQQLLQSSFMTRFVARGFKSTGDCGGLDREVVVVVTGPEMGYVTTPVCVVGAANMVLKFRERIPHGVLTPAVAFGMVVDELLVELKGGGVEFKVTRIADRK